MRELFFTLAIIIIILVLILLFILISYFYNSYDENKTKVNTNFQKTTSHINNTNNKITSKIDNINTNINKLDLRTNLIDSNFNDAINKTKIELNNYSKSNNNNISNLQFTNNKTYTNLNNFDANLKQFFQFNDNAKIPNKVINDALFDYRFSTVPNLSMDVLRDININSSMTVTTDNVTKFFKVCDTTKNSCIDLSVNQGKFNIKPSSNSINNITDFNIANKDNQTLANFNFTNNEIYLGNNGEDAGMFIKGNKVYVKDLYLLNKGNNYSAVETLPQFNSNLPNNNYGIFKLDTNYLSKIPRILNLQYNISKDITTNKVNIFTITINSKYKIISGLNIKFNIPNITFVSSSKTILNLNSTYLSTIQSITLNEQICTIIINNDIEPNTEITFTNNTNVDDITFIDSTATVLSDKLQIEF